MWPKRFKYDVFVSHAVEDKLPIANELCKRLEAEGLKLWYSGKELRVGDNLEATIIKALDDSQYGIVILSPTYLQKNWTRKEYYLLMAKEIEQRKVILPVLHEITNEELAKLDIHIADRWATSASSGLDVVVEKLLKVLKAKGDRTGRINPGKNIIVGATALSIFMACYFLLHSFFTNNVPSPQIISSTIRTYIHEQDSLLANDYKQFLTETQAKPCLTDDIMRFNVDFANLNVHYRNEYEFYNGTNTIKTKKNVEAALATNFASMPPHTYNLVSPVVYAAKSELNGKPVLVKYSLKNAEPVDYKIQSSLHGRENEYEVVVSVQNNIRYVFVALIYPTNADTPKRRRTELKGLNPTVKFTFHLHEDKWILQSVEDSL